MSGFRVCRGFLKVVCAGVEGKVGGLVLGDVALGRYLDSHGRGCLPVLGVVGGIEV